MNRLLKDNSILIGTATIVLAWIYAGELRATLLATLKVIAEHEWIVLVPVDALYVWLLWLHVRERGPRGIRAAYAALITLGCVIGFGTVIVDSKKGSLLDLVSLFGIFGIGLFVLLCELLCAGLGKRLTDKYKDKWTKAIDYIYLTLAALGVVSATNDLSIVQEGVSAIKLAAPMLATAAISVRLVKTRAEIGEWNKEEFYVRNPPTHDWFRWLRI